MPSCIFMAAKLAGRIESTEYNKPSNGKAKKLLGEGVEGVIVLVSRSTA